MAARFLHVLAGAVLLAVSANAAAQAYPSKPLRIMIPFAVGSGSDTNARFFGDLVSKMWGQPVIVDSGKFDWAAHADRFPGLTQPDGAYHGVIWTEAVGEIAFLAGGVRTATVTALRDSLVLRLGRAEFEQLFDLAFYNNLRTRDGAVVHPSFMPKTAA